MSKYLMMITHAFILAALLASSHGVLKWVSTQDHDSYPALLLQQWKMVALALSIYGVVFFYYILVLRSSPISSLYPIYTGLSVLMVMLVGRMVFSELISTVQILGAGFILAGIVLMGSGS